MTHTRLKSLTLILSSLTMVACAGTHATQSPVQPPTPSIHAKDPGPSIDRDAVRAKLAAKRTVQIDRLRAYSAKGVFPKNVEQPGMLNVFIDDDGAICAAANLMWQDGQKDLVQTTAKNDNYLRLVTVSTGPLMNWMMTSGLTQEEIDRIQEPYSFIDEPVEPAQPSPQIAAEVKRLQAHFAVVLDELENNWEASLDAATDRLVANPTLVASL